MLASAVELSSTLVPPAHSRSGGSRRRQVVACAKQDEQQQKQRRRQQDASRREVVLLSTSSLLLAPLAVFSPGTDDNVTVLNSLLGAYGLPEIRQDLGKSWRTYDDFDVDYTFVYPRGWVGRANSLRPGLYLSNFKTADKASVEIFPEPPAGADFAQEVVAGVLFPGEQAGGNSRLELPPRNRIRSDTTTLDGQEYTYLAFTSTTTTRSGYDVKRKNVAVAAVRKGMVYALCASARGDQYDADKGRLLARIVESFRLR